MRFLSLFVTIVVVLAAPPARALDTAAKQAILIDDATGTVLLEKNADAAMSPSSMSKLMTLYAVFKRLKEGSLKLDDAFVVSEKAWRMQGSKTFVEVGKQVSVEDLIRGIVVQSGNDACIVIAEGLAGSEEAFAEHLNALAGEIGLEASHFTNATGWPDDGHLMTARDLGRLAHRLMRDFPEYHHYFGEASFTYHGIAQPNRNTLIARGLGVDGLKTGHTEAGGYGIAVSAQQEGRRIILVVNGLASESERAREAEALVRAAFRDFETVTLLPAGRKMAEAKVWFGTASAVGLGADEDVAVTLPRDAVKKATFTLRYAGPVAAPVKAGTPIAELDITIPDQKVRTVALVALEDVEELSGFSRLLPAIYHYVFGR